MDLKITLPIQFGLEKNFKFSLENINYFLEQINSYRNHDKIIIDAKNTEWIEPIGYALLESFLVKILENKNIKIEIILPEKGEVREFLNVIKSRGLSDESLEYMGLIKVNQELFKNIQQKDDKLISKIENILKNKNINENLIKILIDWSLPEIITNIFHHSERDYGHTCLCVYPNKNKIQLVIIDNGIGIKNSFQKNKNLEYSITDNISAVSNALEKGITSNPHDFPIRDEGNGGIGLYIASQLLRENEGLFYLHSGDGSVIINKGEKTNNLVNYRGGTIVVIEINLTKNINYDKIQVDHYTNNNESEEDFSYLNI